MTERRLEDIIIEAIDAMRAEVRTSIPGEILSYDHSEQRATVKPTVKLRRKNPESGESEFYEPAPITNVPVQFDSSSNHAITFPLSEGDTGEIKFQSRAIGKWLQTGVSGTEHEDPRRHDISDAVFEPGLRAFVDALGSSRLDADALVVASDDEIHLGSGGLSTDKLVALAAKVEQELSDLKSTVDDFVDDYNAHTHGNGQNLAPSASGESASKHGSIDSTAATKTKAE